jgi:phosphoglycolate phosphatase-like HAD superfamily hydrolase
MTRFGVYELPAKDYLSLLEDAVETDARWDVESAWKLGLDAVCLTSGGISETELREAGAVAVYADPQALLDDFENSPLGRLAPAD